MPIAKRILSTLGSLLLTLLGLSVLTFFIGRIMPTDPVLAMVGDNAPEYVVQRAREEMGLNQPLWVQFGRYLSQLLHGDLGNSILTSNPVMTDIARFFPATLELATAAIIIAALVGIPLGVWAAVRQSTWVDQTIRVVCLAGHSLPVFVLALLSLLIFYAALGIAPGPRRQDIIFQDMVPQVTGLLTVDSLLAWDYAAFHDALAHMAQPVLILAYFSMAYITRMTRTFMLNALSGEYVITARQRAVVASGDLASCLSDRCGSVGDRIGTDLCRAVGRGGGHGKRVRLAGAGPIPHHGIDECRYEPGDWCHAAGGHRVRAAQFAG